MDFMVELRVPLHKDRLQMTRGSTDFSLGKSNFPGSKNSQKERGDLITGRALLSCS